MAKQIRVISDSDWEVLKRIVAANQNLQQSPPQRPRSTGQYLDGDDSMSPEVYIALPPAGGIPALGRTTSAGTGTGSGTSTSPQEWDTPGSATCGIYQIILDSERIPNLIKVQGPDRVVYNLSASALPEDWLTVHRDKFGKWLAATSGSGCESQNTIWDIIITGAPTGGTFTLTVDINGIAETLTFDYNDTASQAESVFEGHSQIALGDVDVTNGPFPNATMRVEFLNNLSNQLINLPVANWGSLTGGSGKSVIIAMAQRGHG